MVSGFLISPYDQDRIFSGLAIEILIWSNTCAGACGLKRFMISWFIVFSACRPCRPLSCHSLFPAPPHRDGECWLGGRRPPRSPPFRLLGRFRRGARRLLGV